MAGPRIDIQHAGAHELLTGRDIQRVLRAEAEKIASRAGPGHEVEVRVGRNRARSTIRTATIEARLAQRNHGTLRKALGR